MRRLLCFATSLFALVALGSTKVLADTRVALLIGNAHYTSAGLLRNPPNDVVAVADALKAAGFDSVTTTNDLGHDRMIKALREFEDKASTADIAVIYYSGHGLEMNGINYLVPVDATIKSDSDVEDEAITLDRAMRAIERAKRLKLVILDACREDPFSATMSRRSGTRDFTRGLSRIEPKTVDTLVAFSAKAGTVASDGDGTNSPFTASLVKRLIEPGVDIRIAFGKVRDDVLESTHQKQEPFVYGSLGGTQLALSKVEAPIGAEDARAFEAAKLVGTVGAYDAFIASYPNSFYSNLAREVKLALQSNGSRSEVPPPTIEPTSPPVPAPATVVGGPEEPVVQTAVSNCIVFNGEQLCP